MKRSLETNKKETARLSVNETHLFVSLYSIAVKKLVE